MPRFTRRSQAARRREGEQQVELGPPQPPREEVANRRGTGHRHRVRRWPRSAVTGLSHKLSIPPESPNEKFVLLVGDSHLRAIADGIVPIMLDKDSMSFGVMCTPGASAAELTAELLHADVPRTPDAVCLLAPSNNLTSSRTFEEAGASFANLVACACSRWPKVCVVDFPPRLTVDPVYQDVVRQEFRRVAARLGTLGKNFKCNVAKDRNPL
ncbi:uncharacterized protein LOC114432565 [Parambassis ranga]|uniref:Uncharacterized protein LOC114432565 n=1 Tax=Parambassis ranga TaxID=210632 RepID=A0A6P7HRZ7_9TELE|nr:uncharacterized protein LOC114432565 [Parambassis ranga]